MNFSEQLTPADIDSILHRLGVDPKGRPDASGWITIKSPLRDDKNPSFGLNVNTGAWKDHATGHSGDLVKLTEHINRTDTEEAIKWIKKNTDAMDALYSPPKKPKPKKKKFWNPDRISWIKNGMNQIDQGHELLKVVQDYDCIEPDTLKNFGCGIVTEWNQLWLAIPYPTGCQLYRRDDGKVIRSVKESSPGDSFFGMKAVKNQSILFIAKSPREAMLLHQLYGDRADVIGICTGEQGKVSSDQISSLTRQISRSKYSFIYTFLDSDTDEALEIAKSFAKQIAELAEDDCDVKRVDVYKSTGQHKDISDCIRSGETNVVSSLLSDAESIKSINNTESITTRNDIFDVSKAPPIPDQVFDHLPDLLKNRCDLIEQKHRKDVFLVSALPVLASHLTKVVAGHADGYYTPDLFTLIVADPGAGKGVASKAKKFGTTLNKHLIEVSKRDRDNYESMPADEKIYLSEPKDRSLFIPANSSSRAIYDTLEANNGWGLLFENEIDTMINATGQEWGNFSDITRKAFHHEDISINRKNERFFIDSPRLSICITGTFDQFRKMFESAENGHFSRYALYTFDVPRQWQSHRPTKKSVRLDESIQSASDSLHKLFITLQRRQDHLYIDLTDKHWGKIDEMFAHNMQMIDKMDLSTYLHASNNRAAILALRMASMFCVIRTWEENPGHLEYADSLTPSNSDMIASLYLADTFINHAIRLYTILPKATNTDGKGERYENYLSELPDNFTTSQALDIGEGLEIPEPTIKRWLSDSNDIERIKHGHYRRIST